MDHPDQLWDLCITTSVQDVETELMQGSIGGLWKEKLGTHNYQCT